MKRKVPIDTIMVHCTATPPRREVTVAELDKWHKARNFERCSNGRYAGYHLLVHLDGSYERIRPDEERGQHCTQGNMNNRAAPCRSAMSAALTTTTSRAIRAPKRRSGRSSLF